MIHAIVATTGCPQVDVLGHSMGGAIALLYAGRYSAEVAHLVLADVAGVLHREAYVGDHIDRALDPVHGTVPRLGQVLSGAAKSVTGQLRKLEPDLGLLPRSGGNQGAAGGQAALALIQLDLGPAIAAVHAPTLLLWGERDQTAARRTANLLYDRLPARGLSILPGIGHVPMTDAPARMVELVEAHLGDDSPVISHRLSPTGEERIGACRGQSNVIFRGGYARIDIDHCRQVTLVSVVTQQIVIRSSDAELTHVYADHGMVAEDSDLTITGGEFAGPIALEVSASRIDAAGVALLGATVATRGGRPSRLLFSVTRVDGPRQQRFLHGEFVLQDGQEL